MTFETDSKELMHEFAAQKLKPGQVFSRKDAAHWFADHYPKIKGNTVGLHVEGMSVNSRSRRHNPGIRPDIGWDLFFKLGASEFRLWDPEKPGIHAPDQLTKPTVQPAVAETASRKRFVELPFRHDLPCLVALWVAPRSVEVADLLAGFVDDRHPI